jgi:predicted nucleic acid-binding protein
VNETATLLLARGYSPVLSGLLDAVFESKACGIEWVDPERSHKTRKLFLKREDQTWSFTDGFSFLVMKELGLSRSLTKDEHFTRAGFVALL